jgi:hypothetical protein
MEHDMQAYGLLRRKGDIHMKEKRSRREKESCPSVGLAKTSRLDAHSEWTRLAV